MHHLAFIGPGGPEILVVMLVLLLMFGAKDAPRIFRKITDLLNQFRTTAENFKREVMYSDIGDDAKPDYMAGEYDDYGVGSPDNHAVSNEEQVDAVGTENGSSCTDEMQDEGEGGGNVQKN
ncbi:MAG TPA: twin-arginine translocase TatA/TatE family subunit [Pontiella sp.]|nr:twin-arginine translocase TatA/TatE family subunit [Pontiella sp.]